MDENTAMEPIRHFLQYDWMKLIVPLTVFGITLVAGLAAKRLLSRVMQAWSARTKSQAAVMVTRALLQPFTIWVLILAIHLAMES